MNEREELQALRRMAELEARAQQSAPTEAIPAGEGDYRQRAEAGSKARLRQRQVYANAPGVSALETYGVAPGDKIEPAMSGPRMLLERGAAGVADIPMGAVQLASNVTGLGSDTINRAMSQREQTIEQARMQNARAQIARLISTPEFQQLAKDSPSMAQGQIDALLPGIDLPRLMGSMVVPGVVAAKGSKLVAPTVSRLPTPVRAVANTGMGAAGGGLTALVTPEEVASREEYAQTKKEAAPVAAGIGAAIPLVGSAINAGINAGRVVSAPFAATTQKGQERIVGRMLSGAMDATPEGAAQRQALMAQYAPSATIPAQPIPGVTRTLTGETLNPNIAQIERQFPASMDPAYQQNIAARAKYLKRLGASDAEIDSMIAARRAADSERYGMAYGSEDRFLSNAKEAQALREQADSLTQQAGKDYTIATQSQRLAEAGRYPKGYESATTGKKIGGRVVSPSMQGQADSFKSATEDIQNLAVNLRQRAMMLERENDLASLSGKAAVDSRPLAGLLSDPQMQRVVRAAQQDMQSLGIPGDITSLRGLHFIKTQLDDMMQAGYSPVGTSLDAINSKVLGHFKSKIDDVLNQSEGYRIARQESAKAARPIDAARVGNRIVQKALPGPVSPTTGEVSAISDAGLRSAVADERALLKKTTGYDGARRLRDVLSPEQSEVLRVSSAESARDAEAKRLMGLTDAQSGDVSLRQLLANLPIGTTARAAAKLADIVKMGGTEGVSKAIVRALKDPATAARFMREAERVSNTRQAQELLAKYAGPVGGTAGGTVEREKRRESK